MAKKIVVFTGAGVSADSGISTFRDSDGLWENYSIEEVCTAEAIVRDREKVISFYNMRRRDVLSKEPNAAHIAIAKLEKYFESIDLEQAEDADEYADNYDFFTRDKWLGISTSINQYVVLSDADSCQDSLKSHLIVGGKHSKNIVSAIRYQQEKWSEDGSYVVSGVCARFTDSDAAEACFDNLSKYTSSRYEEDDYYYEEFEGEDNNVSYIIVDTELGGVFCMYLEKDTIFYIKADFIGDSRDYDEFSELLNDLCNEVGVVSPLNVIERV